MPAHYDEKRKRWRYRYRGKIAGIKVTISGTPASNTKRAAEAEERIALEQKRRELENPRLARVIPSLSEWGDTWLLRIKRDCAPGTYESRESVMRVHLLPRFGSRRLDEIEKADVQVIIDELSAQGYSAATVRYIGGTLIGCLRAAMTDEIIDRVPRVKLPREVAREDFLSEEETALLVQACKSTEERVAIVLGARAGLRNGEIRGIRWEDWQRNSRTLRVLRQITRHGVRPPKWDHKRTVPVHADLESALDAHEQFADPSMPWVFHRRGKPFSEDTLDLLLGRVAKRVSVEMKERIHWHLLRHTCASHLAIHGVSLLTIGSILGHKNWKTTQRYAKLCPSATVTAIDTLPPISEQSAQRYLRAV